MHRFLQPDWEKSNVTYVQEGIRKRKRENLSGMIVFLSELKENERLTDYFSYILQQCAIM